MNFSQMHKIAKINGSLTHMRTKKVENFKVTRLMVSIIAKVTEEKQSTNQLKFLALFFLFFNF